MNYNNLFNLCFKESDNLFILLSDRLYILDINSSAEKILGWNKDDIYRENISNIFKRYKTQPFIKTKVITKISITTTKVIYENNVLIISWQIIPIHSVDEHNAIFVLGKVSTQATNLRFNNTQLDNILKYAPGLVYWKDVNSVYQGCNDEFARLAGLESREQVKGKTDFDLIWKDGAALYMASDQQVLKTGRSNLNIEEVIATADNKKSTMISNKVPLLNKKNEVIGIMGITTDITAQKMMEEDLRIAKEEAENALLSMKQAQTKEQKHREESERLALENATHMIELEAQAEFIKTIEQVAHDIDSPVGGLVTLTNHLSHLDDITSISGYRLALVSKTSREKNVIYLEQYDKGIKYEVIGLDEKLKKGIVLWEHLLCELKTHFPKNETETPRFQKECLAILLELTSKAGHTKKEMDEKRIPEEYRIDLRNATERISDIMNGLLIHYRPKDSNTDEQTEEKQLVLLSTSLLELLSEKRMQYHHQQIKFVDEFTPESQFAFINVQRSQINRAISNLMNNAAQAFDGTSGKVTLKLTTDNEFVHISVQDNGKGMPAEMVDRIMQNVSFTEGKKDGHGIGLSQVRDMLKRNFGNMNIQSSKGKGTQFTLSFAKKMAPAWCAETIEVTPHDIIVILDDDRSIHGAWDMRFKAILKQLSQVRMHHFYTGEETLEFIDALNDIDKKHLLLLTDFELLNQKHNGISVIEQSKTKRAILVTSHYAKPEIQHQIMSLNVKLLPKKLASNVPIIIAEPTIDYSDQQLNMVDAVWLDDDPEFTLSHERNCAANQKKVEIYRNPKVLMDNIHIYPKNTPIFLDNNFAPPFDNEFGTEIAQKLHDLGFTNLFLITGDRLKQSDYPYVKILVKHNVQTLLAYL